MNVILWFPPIIRSLLNFTWLCYWIVKIMINVADAIPLLSSLLIPLLWLYHYCYCTVGSIVIITVFITVHSIIVVTVTIIVSLLLLLKLLIRLSSLLLLWLSGLFLLLLLLLLEIILELLMLILLVLLLLLLPLLLKCYWYCHRYFTYTAIVIHVDRMSKYLLLLFYPLTNVQGPWLYFLRLWIWLCPALLLYCL